MNRAIPYIITILMAVALTSCDKDSGKKSTIELNEYESDYGELAEKYATMEFGNCQEAIAAGNEIASVFYATADKAFKENDAKAKSDLEHFDDLFISFDLAVESMYSTCPEEFDKWEKDNRKKIDAIKHKRDKLYSGHETDTTWTEDVSSEIEAVNVQVEQLMIDIQKFEEEDVETDSMR